jgi:group I intron endonuclease
MSTSVYWIHHPEHTDMFTQGYIGVSKCVEKRWYDHKNKTGNLHLARAIKKYGWDNLIKEVIVIADKSYCLMLELKLRAEDAVGWNIVKGGGMPPSTIRTGWKHTEEAKEKNRQSKLGQTLSVESRKKLSESLKKVKCVSRFKKGISPHNKGVPALPHVMEAVRKANTGRVQPQEEKDNRSKSMMGHKSSQKVVDRLTAFNKACDTKCPHCDKTGNIGSMARWHMDNCKFKEAQSWAV